MAKIKLRLIYVYFLWVAPHTKVYPQTKADAEKFDLFDKRND